MAKSSPNKGGHIGHREVLRTRVALKLAEGTPLTGSDLKDRFYGDVAVTSFHKTFGRDCLKLEEEGIFLVEETHGTAKSYRLDGQRSLAKPTAKADEDARVLGTLFRPLAESPSTAGRRTLGEAIPRVTLSTCAGPGDVASPKTDCDPLILETVADALRSRIPVELTYQAVADKRPKKRILSPMGMFSLKGSTYVVGLSEREGRDPAMRTYNLSRATSVKVREGDDHYEVPADFDINDWRLLPFEIGDDHVEAVLYAGRDAVKAFKQSGPKSGTIQSRQGGACVWTGIVKDVNAAAKWCVEQGVWPLEPAELVDSWRGLLEGAIS